MKNVLLVNQFNSDNLGDKLLNEVLKLQLEKYNMNVLCAGFAQSSEQNIDYNINRSKNGIKSIIKNNIPPKFKFFLRYRPKLERVTLKLSHEKIDVIVIGGGQLLKHNSVFMYCLSFWVLYAKKYDIPVYLFGVGMDDDLSIKEQAFYRKIFKNVSYINCRDWETADKFKTIFGINVEVSPDVAFTTGITINPNKENRIVVMPYSLKTARNSFGYVISKKEYYRDILKKINEKNFNQVLLAATTTADAIECNLIKEYLSRFNLNAEMIRLNTVNDLIELLVSSKSIITGRMHAMIVGLLSQCEILPIYVSRKIKVFEKEYLENNGDLAEIRKRSLDGVKRLVKKIQEVQEGEIKWNL